MDLIQSANPAYSTLHFLVKHGRWVALISAILPAIAGITAWLMGMTFILAIAGVVAGVFLYLIMSSYVELVQVIVDMLLPK